MSRTSAIGARSAPTILMLAALAAAPGSQASGAQTNAPGAVYTMSNSAAGNEIFTYQRGSNGMLTAGDIDATGGLGTGSGLGNQGGIALSASHHRLFVVNAGSNDISAFRVGPKGLTLTDVEPALGDTPVSVAVHGNLLYVLNGGGAGSIQGFTIDGMGDLDPIPDSMRSLSGAMTTAPAEIGFTPDGGVLVVTEKATNLIDTYRVWADGTTEGPFVFESNGQTPFGFDFTSSGDLLVSEAFGGMAGASAASSYSVAPDGTLELVSGTVPSFETAACWLVVSGNSHHAYVTNTGSGTISGYDIDGPTGAITLLDGVAADAGAGTGPLDAAFSTNGRFLYTLLADSHEIAVYRVLNGTGALLPIQVLSGVPETANGLAAN